jgi:hypothetical protein
MRDLFLALPLALVLALAACGGGKPANAPGGADQARADLDKIHAAVGQWKAVKMGATACPTVAELKKDKALAADAAEKDPWGQPYSITCTETDFKVRSAGPDGVAGNDDDVVVTGK